MSDTVKLIIEIPENYYKVLTESEIIMTSPRSGKTFMSVIYSAIAHGIPLDDVKAEIQDKGFNSPLMNPVFTMTEILEIIDNIGKAESEG